MSDILSYAAFEQAVGLAKVDWNARYHEKQAAAKERKAAALVAAAADSASVAASAATADLDGLLGTYEDKAYGRVTVCPAARDCMLSDYPHMADACESLYSRLAGVLPGDGVQSLQPLKSALLIDKPGGFFGGFGLALRYSGKGQVWTGQFQELFAIVQEDEQVGAHEMLTSSDEADSVHVRFVDGRMEWSGVWGAGKGVIPVEGQVEVVFNKV